MPEACLRNRALFLSTLVILSAARALSAEKHSAAAPAPAPAPAVDCSFIVLKLVDCLNYVTSNATASPSLSCCKGLKKVMSYGVNTANRCLCDSFHTSSSSITLDLNHSVHLPLACGVTNLSINNCGFGPAHAPAPAYEVLPPSVVPQLTPPTVNHPRATSQISPAPPPSSSGLSPLVPSVELLVLTTFSIVLRLNS